MVSITQDKTWLSKTRRKILPKNTTNKIRNETRHISFKSWTQKGDNGNNNGKGLIIKILK
jgi:hypothetical protein